MQENLKDEECQNCKYCFTGLNDEGTCRRYPPVLDETFIRNFCKDDKPSSACDSMLWWSQPVVMLDSWCGEFKPKHGEKE